MEYGKIQWHPAFDAALQITLREDAGDLMFEAEHLLGKKPLQIDGVIIKRDPRIWREIPSVCSLF